MIFKQNLDRADLKTIAKDESLDLWIMHHFKVLPTDDRYKKLTENQKTLLFYGWTELPSSEQIKRFHDGKAGDPVIDDTAEKNFARVGYTPDQIERMKEQLNNAGYCQPN